jgi:chromosome segregation ATPase
MAIASVVQGLIETEDGRVFELDSGRGSAWLESIGSFRYEPTGANKPYTVRQETKKGGDYWYGYRKVAGKLHKKYIGKSSELSTAKLEEIAEALNTPQQPRVTQVADTVTQVTEANNQQVTDAVTDSHTAERVTALELQMQALRESLEALQSELLGKHEGLSSFSELPNPDEVTDSELQIELGNLRTELSNLATENEKIRADYDALLESSTVVTNKLRQELAEVRSQLATEQTRWDELREELDDRDEVCERLRSQLTDREAELAALRSELADLKQKSAAASKDLPEAADLLNQLKTRRKKSSSSLADVELILEMVEELIAK